MNPKLPHGIWPTDLSAAMVAEAGVRIGSAVVAGKHSYWWEGRPAEGGRGVVVCHDGNTARDLTPANSNVRSRVHEYDGGSWTVLANGAVAFVEAIGQHITIVDTDGSQRRLTTHDGDIRYGDLTDGGDVLFAIRERHTEITADEAVNDIVAIELDSGALHVVASGHDFFSSPRPRADSDQLAYICWDHPAMPWDNTELHVVNWSAEAGPKNDVAVLTGQAVQQPMWTTDGLVVITDPDGWWVPCSIDLVTGMAIKLLNADIEIGVAPWVFGMSTMAANGSDLFVVTHSDGVEHLCLLSEGALTPVTTARTAFGAISQAAGGGVVCTAASFTSTAEVVVIGADGSENVIRPAPNLLDANSISSPTHISFGEGDSAAHGLFYAPTSTVAEGPIGELPPLLVLSHGGPTGAARPGLDLGIQFWTQRGFAVVDVNYRGSTGYGREFRDALRGKWGLADVEDCIAAAKHLTTAGLVDGERLLIKGGSAGGYTTLCALTFHDTFAAGASRYGIGDLELLARDTHKFESRYLDSVVGPYPAEIERYRDRSPMNFVEQLSTPMIILQGGIDPVVPPNQAHDMVAALDGQKVPHAFLLFPTESHGFREAANITKALVAEHTFFCRVLGIATADELPPLDIVHL
ncbi:MAG: S9 family peptidase [Actinobacteria bacterium]|nr:S9 family peptidase [Actinomycetota bacterium]